MTQIDARLHPRRTPSVPVFLSFTLEGRRMADAEVVSVGLGGIGTWMDESYVALFEPKCRLREIVFSHPDFPMPTPDLRLVFSTLKGQSARPGHMMFGAEFIDPSPAFMKALEEFLASSVIWKLDASEGPDTSFKQSRM